MPYELPIETKTRRILTFVGCLFLLLAGRSLYLTAFQYDKWERYSRRPQVRTVVLPTERATITDRFGIPLATNKTQYNACVYYAHIKQIPRIATRRDSNGKKERYYPRLEHIQNLSTLLAKELNLHPADIEDMIHGRAALFPHTPFVIKSNLEEKTYYKLRMMQRDWTGLSIQRGTRRHYPKGRVGADVVGYLGRISDREYRMIAQERDELENYLDERKTGQIPFLPKGFDSARQVQDRLQEIKEKAYTMNDLVGKSGIESKYDATLRGYCGKDLMEVDMEGNVLRKLPGSKERVSGHKLVLALSAELQEYAEKLLAENEEIRRQDKENEPWIRGGSIVAMLPKSGEVVCMASHPRFDPNDFIPFSDDEKGRKARVNQWLENQAYIGDVWDGKRKISKEVYDGKAGKYLQVQKAIFWPDFLASILSLQSEVYEKASSLKTLRDVYLLQQAKMRLMGQIEESNPSALIEVFEGDNQGLLDSNLEAEKTLFKRWVMSIKTPKDRLLLLDLCRLIFSADEVSDELIEKVGSLSVAGYRLQTQTVCQMKDLIRQELRQKYKHLDFADWREANFKAYLKKMRKIERKENRYNKPYIDYLDKLEKEHFESFINENMHHFIDAFICSDYALPKQLEKYDGCVVAVRDTIQQSVGWSSLVETLATLDRSEREEYVASMKSYRDLKEPLYGRYRFLRSARGEQQLCHLAGAFYPVNGYGIGRSQAYRQSTPSGSLFKLVTAYQSLIEKYEDTHCDEKKEVDINPLTLIDHSFTYSNKNREVLGEHLNGEKIHRLYKGGRLPRGHPNIGKINIAGAIETSSNIYFSILAGDVLRSPESLAQATRKFSFGAPTGIELPGEIGGGIPSDIGHNKTGLYAFAIGQHSLIVTPLQTAVMLSALANGGHVLKPKVVHAEIGDTIVRDMPTLFGQREYHLKDDLARVGVDFPLFTEVLKRPKDAQKGQEEREVVRKLPMPKEVIDPIYNGMWGSLNGPKGTARSGIIRRAYSTPNIIRDYHSLKGEMIGKTGTAEILHKATIDSETKAKMEKHVWFGAFSFKKPPEIVDGKKEWGEPELAVVVYLRFGRAGKEAAPLAAQIVKKWRELCEKHGVISD